MDNISIQKQNNIGKWEKNLILKQPYNENKDGYTAIQSRDCWAGAVMRKPLGIQKCYRQTDGLTDRPARQGVESRVRV